MPEAGVGPGCDFIGDQDFLGKSDDEQRHADPEVARVETLVRGFGELRHHFAVMQDRAGEQMGKETHEQAVVDERQFARPPAIRIDQKGDLGKREKTDAQRQDHPRQQPVRAQQCVGIRDKKVGIFEVAQQRQIGDDAECEPGLMRTRPGRCRPPLQCPADCEVEQDAAQQQGQEPPVPVRVKETRRGEQPRQPGAPRLPAVERVVNQARRRQKGEQERVGIEQHSLTVC